MENLSSNQPWGDIVQEKKPFTTRIYSQNVNGLQYQKDGGQYVELCRVAKEVQADVLCIQEHNLDTTQHQVQHTLQQATRKHWQRAKLTVSSSPITFQGTWKPGGTAILSAECITGRLVDSGHDSWGRWTYQTFRGQNGVRVIIISAYQVVAQKQTLKGRFTAATQQHSLLLRQGDNVTDPRKAFRRDLSDFIRDQRSKGIEILLIGDFNERIGEDPSGISRLAALHELEDLMHHQHQHLQEPATYARGQKRLDYALGTHVVTKAIVACGYEQFNFRFHTDHRALFLDFDTRRLFGAVTQSLAPYTQRTLHSNNLRQVTKYIQEKYQLLAQCNAFERGKQLEASGNRHKFAERLDLDITRMSLVAEQRTQRYREPAWSLELSDARKKVSILSKWLSMGTTRIDQVSTIQEEMKGLKTPILLPETSAECSKALKTWKRKVKEIIDKSFETRASERDRQIAQLELEVQDSKTKAKIVILRNLRKAEAIKQMFQKLQMLRNKRKRGGITMIEVPENENDDPRTCTHWKTIELPAEIATHLLHRNRKHFGQAHGTPFTVSPLQEHLGFTGQTEHAEAILCGHYDVARLDRSVQLLVQHLIRVERSTSHPIQPSITVDEFLSKMKSWRESTSTSPSGMHLGHYKAMSARHIYSDLPDNDPRKMTINTMQDELIQLHIRMINYALERGYTYERWTNVANAMLFKEPGNMKIHRTRVIHIYEADYNLAMGLKWRAAMHLAEDSKLLNPGQYGSRPSRGAHDPVFIEEMQMEISRLTRKSIVQINYDATSCYDRIIPNLAAIVSQKFGVPQPVTQTNAVTLERAKYRLKTELGLSEQTYSHQGNKGPIYGTGQGSGNSPMIWCFLSSVLFDAYEKHAQGATYEFPDRSGRISIRMVGYVDDSNGQSNMFTQDKQPTIEELLKVAQSDAQQWHDLLQASGGALELTKCTYQALSWTFNKDGWPCAQGLSSTNGIRIHTGSDQYQRIPEISAHTAHKTLGHYKDPAGNQYRQRQVLLEKSNQAAAFVSRSPLTREEAWTYYFAIYLPSIGYPLQNCYFTKHELDRIQQKFMSEITAKCGYNRKTKREIIYGPAHLGGANFRTLYSVQGVGQVTTLLKFWRSPCQAGQLLRIAVAWAQYVAGTSTPILEDVGTPLPHLETKWITSLRTYLKYTGATIELDESYVTNREREHDWHIMDAIIQSGKFSPKEIRQLNYCRLYLQATTISDIANAKGDALDVYLLKGNINHQSSSCNKWHKVNQERPADANWKLWHEATKLWSTITGKLHQPLGKWLQPISQQRRRWPAYASTTGLIFIRVSTNSTRFNQHRISQKDCEGEGWYQVNTHCKASTKLPDNVFPVPILQQEQGVRLVHMGSRRRQLWQSRNLETKSLSMTNQDFSAYIGTTEAWECELLQHVIMDSDAFTICERLRAGFVAACDGSVEHETNGSFGWIIAATSGQRLVKAYGPARGRKPSSYRAEGYGVLSFHRFLVRIQEFCSISIGNDWSVTSDNIALVNKLNGMGDEGSSQGPDRVEVHDWSDWHEISNYDIDDGDVKQPPNETGTANTLDPDWDIINEIMWNRERSGINVGKIAHIHGHQDRKKRYQELSLAAQLNVDADALAREYQRLHGKARPIVLQFPHAGASLHFAHGTCTSQIPRALRWAENEQPLAKYIKTRNKWDESTFQLVDWEAHSHVIKRNARQRIHITKLVHDLVPTNKLVHRDHPKAQRCVACQAGEVEDRDHVLRCGHSGRGQWRDQFIASLTAKGVSIRSDPIMLRILIDGLHQWLQGCDNGHDELSVPKKYQRLVKAQNKIGWRQVFNGRMSKEWARLQADYIFLQQQRALEMRRAAVVNGASGQHMAYERIGTRWTSEIIHEIWIHWKIVWTQRNEILHGHDGRTRREKQYQRDASRLQTIYDNQAKLEPSVRELLFANIEEHRTTCSQMAIHNWLAVHETTFIQSVKNATKRAVQGVRSIKSYFLPKDRSRAQQRHDTSNN